MKKSVFSKIIALFLLGVVVFGATSCNRGYGCPYNVKMITSTISKVVLP